MQRSGARSVSVVSVSQLLGSHLVSVSVMYYYMVKLNMTISQRRCFDLQVFSLSGKAPRGKALRALKVARNQGAA